MYEKAFLGCGFARMAGEAEDRTLNNIVEH